MELHKMSNSPKKQIIAIGGGGFSKYGEHSPVNFLMEEYILKQTQKPEPRICFIPTASGDALKYIVDFYSTFSKFSCKPSHLSLFEPPIQGIESFILEQDAIYVGGGNTKSMLALWREWKLDVILRKAWEKGIVLSGISAGALCWFEEGVTDSISGTLTRLPCMGFLPGSHCPHYDSESGRRGAFHQLIKDGMANGVACDDNVAVHYLGRELAKVVRSSGSGAAYVVQKGEGEIVEKPIEAVSL
jgi:dipeptidase E